MKQYFSDIFFGLQSLFAGLWITIIEFFKPKVTEYYPYEEPVLPKRFRGHIELVSDEEGKSKCIVCGLCQRVCPSGCINLAGEKPEGSKKKVLTKYDLDFTLCSLCGSCIESCHVGAIRFSHEYNLASSRKEDFHMDLLKRMEETT
ncbi:NADH-quinone oxidoreductase subunit I [candidate division KSB3 bacterium]|uniref:NADH-quinone oxidoreductase subunit I n=1 Tax=candidate division KSB3 bacterium TaxID=2044937 RepID=A0A2G6E1D8_9BACT|nr:MAG: NADH-quinone oxidoreductase subunit I [candidate division KSB3 bacterium]